MSWTNEGRKDTKRFASVLVSVSMIIIMVFPAIHVADAQSTVAGALVLNHGEGYLRSSVIDPLAGFAYFGTSCSGPLDCTTPGIIVKVRLSDFTLVSVLTLKQGENDLRTAVIDPVAGFAYFGTFTQPGIVVRIRLSDFTETGSLTINDSLLSSSVIDPVAGFAYFGNNENDIDKVRLSDFTQVGFMRIRDAWGLSAPVIDPAGGFAYWGTMALPGVVVKISLSDFTEAGTLTLNPNEGWLWTSLIDLDGDFIYFGTLQYPASIVKIRLSNFTRAGELTLITNENILQSAVIDPVGFAYFAARANLTQTSPDTLVKVNLSNFARDGSMTLSTGENYLQTSIIDPARGSAYFGTETSPGVVVKVEVPPAPPDFTLSPTPHIITVEPGFSGAFTIVLNSLYGFTGAATLSILSLPANMTATFTNPTISSSQPSNVTITVGRFVAPGIYAVQVNGTSGSQTHSASLTIHVVAHSPSPSPAATILGLKPSIFYLTVGGIVSLSVILGTAVIFRRKKSQESSSELEDSLGSREV